MERTFYIETYGCQMNVHDTEKLSGILASLGYSPAPTEIGADLVLLNTCSVREKAAQKVFTRLGELKKLKQGKPGLTIGVCGCLAQQEGDRFLKGHPYVDLVFGPRNIGQLPSLLENLLQERRQLLALSGPRQEPTFEAETILRESKVKAYITIMEGCDKFCTFCVVPFLRGRETSRNPDFILKEARRLGEEEGFLEICLLGQNVNSYRFGSVDFADLLMALGEIEAIRRIRYTSPHPSDINEKVMDLYRWLPSLSRNLHLPLQAGSNAVLKRMRRDYTREIYLDKVHSLRQKRLEMALSTDIIVGFPGETDDDFELTMDIVRQVEYSNIFSFKYSPRPYTAALKLEDDVPEAVKAKRLQRLQDLQKEIQTKLNSALIGTIQEVLVESRSRKGMDSLSGRTTCNRVVNFTGEEKTIGKLQWIKIESATANSLHGKLLTNYSQVSPA